MPFDLSPNEITPAAIVGTISRRIVEVCDRLGERLAVFLRCEMSFMARNGPVGRV
jgi:hypothetical protein